MKAIHCTNKLIQAIGVSPLELIDHENLKLGDWYANIFDDYNNVTHLAFINTKTLLAFIVENVNKKILVDFHDLFLSGLRKTLINLKVADNTVEEITLDYTRIIITKTASKSMLGSMNDLVLNYKYSFYESDYRKRNTVHDFNRFVNQQPMKPLNWKYPIESLSELIMKEYK